MKIEKRLDKDEIDRRRDETIRRMLNTPPEQHKPLKKTSKKKPRRKPKRTS
jgi:hypothetical protein